LRQSIRIFTERCDEEERVVSRGVLHQWEGSTRRDLNLWIRRGVRYAWRQDARAGGFIVEKNKTGGKRGGTGRERVYLAIWENGVSRPT